MSLNQLQEVCPGFVLGEGLFFFFFFKQMRALCSLEDTEPDSSSHPPHKPGKALQHGLGRPVSKSLHPWVFPFKNKESNKQELALQGGSED